MPWMIKKEDGEFCVHKQNEDKSPGEKLKCYASEAEAKKYLKALYANADKAEKMSIAEARDFLVELEDDEEQDETQDTGIAGFSFTELSRTDVKMIDGLAAGSFTAMNGRQITFTPEELQEYVDNTLSVIESTKTESGEIVGLPIDLDAHDHKGGAGWIVDVSLDKARNVIRFAVKWTQEGVRVIKDNIRRFFSPTADVANKVILGGSMTNWPASRNQAGQMMLRPVELAQDMQVIDTEAFIETLLEFPKYVQQAIADLQAQDEEQEESNEGTGETDMGANDTTNPNLVAFLETPEGAQKLSELAREKAQAMIAADKRKREVVEFASTLVGGTADRPFGLPVKVEDVVTLLLSLPEKQAKAVQVMLSKALTAAIDFAVHGLEEGGQQDLSFAHKPKLDERTAGYLRQWIESGRDIPSFFATNVELGAASDFNLSEFMKAKKE